MKDIRFSLKQKLIECDKHCEKILDAKEFLSPLMPLNVTRYQSLNKIESSFIDQLNFRFFKLQDTMGQSIFRAILVLSYEDVKKMTFLDILNRLEELEILQKEKWLELRETRNEIAQEYSFYEVDIVENINLIYEKADELLKIYQNVKEFLQRKFDIK